MRLPVSGSSRRDDTYRVCSHLANKYLALRLSAQLSQSEREPGGGRMARKIDWESQIGRRLRLRDLHVFFTVVQRGSMAKAAAHLGVSQPAVSEVIADLEHALGVRLLDRNSQGVEPT